MKKNLFTIAAAALLMIAGSANAQEVAIGIRGGLTVPNITPGGTKTPLSEDYSSRLAWGAGAFTELKFTKLFSLQIGLEYSGQGGQKDGVQALPSTPIYANMARQNAALAPLAPVLGQYTPYLYADVKSVAKFNYLMLPVQAKFGWNLTRTSPVRLYVSAGLFASYLTSGERVTTGTSQFYANADKMTLTTYWANVPDASKAGLDLPTIYGIAGAFAGIDAQPAQNLGNTQNITDDLRRFNFGFIGNVGISYSFNRSSVFIEGGGNYGFIKIQKSEANGQNRIGAGTVMVGYSYTLGK